MFCQIIKCLSFPTRLTYTNDKDVRRRKIYLTRLLSSDFDMKQDFFHHASSIGASLIYKLWGTC